MAFEFDDQGNLLTQQRRRGGAFEFDSDGNPIGQSSGEVAPKEDSGDLGRGFTTSFKQLPQLGYGLIAGAGAIGENVFGEGGASTAVKEFGVKGYVERGQDIAKDSKETDSLSYSWDKARNEGDYGAMVDWLQYGIGYGGGQVIQSLASFGLGGIVGKAGLKGVAEHLASGMVTKEAARIAETQAGKALAADQVQKMAVANVATKIGQTVGVGAQAYGMEGGEIFGDLASNNKGPLTGDQIAKGLGATLAAGTLEFATDKLGVDLVLGKSGITKMAGGIEGVGGKAARAGLGLAVQAPAEAFTEYYQTGLEEWGKGKEANPITNFQSETARKHAFDAAGLGFVGGGVPAVVGGALSSPTKILEAQSGDEANRAFTEYMQAGVDLGQGTGDLNDAATDWRRLQTGRDVVSQPGEFAIPGADELINRIMAEDAAQADFARMDQRTNLTLDSELPIIGQEQGGIDDLTPGQLNYVDAQSLADWLKTKSEPMQRAILSSLEQDHSNEVARLMGVNPVARNTFNESDWVKPREITPAIIDLADTVRSMEPAAREQVLSRLQPHQREAVDRVLSTETPTIETPVLQRQAGGTAAQVQAEQIESTPGLGTNPPTVETNVPAYTERAAREIVSKMDGMEMRPHRSVQGRYEVVPVMDGQQRLESQAEAQTTQSLAQGANTQAEANLAALADQEGQGAAQPGVTPPIQKYDMPALQQMVRSKNPAYVQMAKAEIARRQSEQMPMQDRLEANQAALDAERSSHNRETIGRIKQRTVPMDKIIVGRAKAALAQAIGRVFGTDVQFFNDEDGPQGRVIRGEDNTIYLNVRGSISPMAVLGHEMTHILRSRHPQVWDRVAKVVRDNMSEEAKEKFFQDYFSDKKHEGKRKAFEAAKKEGKLAEFYAQSPTAIGYNSAYKTIDELIMEEIVSDLGGNRFLDTKFWEQVFDKIVKEEGRPKGQKIIDQMMRAIIKAINALKTLFNDPKFKADKDFNPEQLDQITEAMSTAYATMFRENRNWVGEGIESYYKVAPKETAKAEPATERVPPSAATGSTADDIEAYERGEVRETPKRAAIEKHKLDAERQGRKTIKTVEHSPEEFAAMLRAAADTGVPADRIAAEAARIKKDFPVSAGWTRLELNTNKKSHAINKAVLKKSLAKKNKDGSPKYTPQTVPLADALNWATQPYAFHLDKDGKIDDATHGKRVTAMAKAMFKDMKDVFDRFSNGDKNAEVVINQAGWYKNMRSRLRAEFGSLGDVFADLLGATSPNTPVRTNWDFAIEALRMATQGKFDNLMPQIVAWHDNVVSVENEFRDWVRANAANFATKKALEASPGYKLLEKKYSEAKKFDDAMMPVRDNGKKFGINGANVALALGDMWRIVESAEPDINKGGTAPKARNFSGNLIGFSERATIDVWAARYLRDLWTRAVLGRKEGTNRIPTRAEKGVAGEWTKGEVNSEFGFGQDVFDEAAKMMRESGIEQFSGTNADDLQAMVWFLEKERWTTNNWTTKDGEGGSFELESDLAGIFDQERVKALRKIIDSSKSSKQAVEDARKELIAMERPLQRFLAGTSIETDDTPLDTEQAEASRAMEKALWAGKTSDYLAAAWVAPTNGKYGPYVEKSFDFGGSFRDGYDVNEAQVVTLQSALDNAQEANIFGVVLPADVSPDPLVHRPMVEFYFRDGMSRDDALEMATRLADQFDAKDGGKLIGGFTLLVDPSRTEGVVKRGEIAKVIGMRYILSPEIMLRYGDESWASKNLTDEQLAEKITSQGEQLRLAAYQILEQEENVTYSQRLWIAADIHFYQEYQNEIAARLPQGGSGQNRAAVWSPRKIRAGLEAADRFNGAPDTQERIRAARSDLLVRRNDARARRNGSQAGRGPDAAGSGLGRESTRRSDGSEAIDGVQGVHYSKEKRTTLSSAFFGTGMKGAELERIKTAKDERIKQRIYFYVNGGRGITPESDVGAHAHRATLDNLYDLDNDPKDLAVGQTDKNDVESAILDAGYDGYMSKSRGVAIMLGHRTMEVEYAGVGKQTAEQPAQASPSAFGKLQRLILASNALPSGQMTGASWKRLMAAVMPDVDVSHLDDAKDYYKDGLVKRPEKPDNPDSATGAPVANATAPKGAVSVFSPQRVLEQARGKKITRQATIAETGETVQLKNQDAEAAIKELRGDIEALEALRLCAGV